MTGEESDASSVSSALFSPEFVEKILSSHMFFKNMNPAIIKTISQEVSPLYYEHGSYIIRIGEESKALFYLLKGKLEIMREDGKC